MRHAHEPTAFELAEARSAAWWTFPSDGRPPRSARFEVYDFQTKSAEHVDEPFDGGGWPWIDEEHGDRPWREELAR